MKFFNLFNKANANKANEKEQEQYIQKLNTLSYKAQDLFNEVDKINEANDCRKLMDVDAIEAVAKELFNRKLNSKNDYSFDLWELKYFINAYFQNVLPDIYNWIDTIQNHQENEKGYLYGETTYSSIKYDNTLTLSKNNYCSNSKKFVTATYEIKIEEIDSNNYYDTQLITITLEDNPNFIIQFKVTNWIESNNKKYYLRNFVYDHYAKSIINMLNAIWTEINLSK
jgi:hypothetical protein